MNEVARFQSELRRVRLLVLDVDGVLTDGRLFYGAKGLSHGSSRVPGRESEHLSFLGNRAAADPLHGGDHAPLTG